MTRKCHTQNCIQTQGTERKSPRTIAASYKLCYLQDDAILTMEPLFEQTW